MELGKSRRKLDMNTDWKTSLKTVRVSRILNRAGSKSPGWEKDTSVSAATKRQRVSADSCAEAWGAGG